MRTNFFPLNKFIYDDIVRIVHQKQNNTQNYVWPKHPRNIITQSPLQGPWWDVIWKSNVFLVQLKWRWRFFFFFCFPPILCRNKGLCKASPILAESVVHDVKKLMHRFVFFFYHDTRPVSARCHRNKIKQKKCDTWLWCLKVSTIYTITKCGGFFNVMYPCWQSSTTGIKPILATGKKVKWRKLRILWRQHARTYCLCMMILEFVVFDPFFQKNPWHE